VAVVFTVGGKPAAKFIRGEFGFLLNKATRQISYDE